MNETDELVFDGEQPPEGFDLAGEQSRAHEAAHVGIAARPGDDEPEAVADAQDGEGAAVDGDDDAEDAPDAGAVDEEV